MRTPHLTGSGSGGPSAVSGWLAWLVCRLYVHLDARAQAAVARVEGCVLRAALLAAARAGRQDKVCEKAEG